MRLEIHLILWVTAVALVTASLFIGWRGETELNSLARASIGLEQDETNPIHDQQATVEGRGTAALPSINPSARSIFPSVMPMVGYEQPILSVNALPVVVGIFSTAGRMAALIVESGGLQPKLFEEGDALGNFVIRHISMDGVVLENTADGTQESILLRGAGELP